ncbi:MAG: methylated-DNA--[protein]-cysteine S-methyltransferase [Syntrophothermaceae bacterium]|jgi:methylated-DNA-[protein]-cysteine S-methyltransferase
MKYDIFKTAWGWAGAAGEGNVVAALVLPLASAEEVEEQLWLKIGSGLEHDQNLFAILGRKLQAYFNGQRVENWGVEVDWSRHPVFTRRVLEYVTGIAYGQTMTYGEVAAALGNPGAARAVGQALGRNLVPLLVPCHRVVGSQGWGGFSAPGGLKIKKDLLYLESGTKNILKNCPLKTKI